MKYKILFIDEEQETLDDFLDYIEASTQKGNITALTQRKPPIKYPYKKESL